MNPPLIVDAHEDLAYNMLSFGRDYTRTAAETRRLEKEIGSAVPRHAGNTLLGWDDYVRGRVAIVFGTLFAAPARRSIGTWEKLAYKDFEQAHKFYRDQLDAYHRLADEHPDKFRFINTQADLFNVLDEWEKTDVTSVPVGLVPLMEGADGVRSPQELEEWWAAGLHSIGLAWAGTRYSGGTREPGPLTPEGRELLEAMADLGFTLDISHMDELAVRQALDLYAGPIIASHANAAALIPGYEGNRQLSDDVIRRLVERDGIIGVIPFNKFLDYTWKPGERSQPVPLETVAAHIDHICQIAGDALHVGLGSDFDGGYGVEMVPEGIDTIADLQKLAPILLAKGYNEEAVTAVFGGNWLRHLQAHLPK